MIKDNIKKIHKTLPPGVTLVAVSKTKPCSSILEAYQAGHRDFGENKVQELVSKQAELPKDIRWHMIGHLQRNKVKFIAPFVHLIHGVDSLNLLQEINKQGIRCNRSINCLLQFHIAREDTKFGLSHEEAIDMLSSSSFIEMKNINIHGVMGMASFSNNELLITEEFDSLYQIFSNLSQHSATDSSFKTISMGMSNDYKLAIEKGSNMLRIGSLIFGARHAVQ